MTWELELGLMVHLAVGPESDISRLPVHVAIHRQPHLVRRISPLNDARALIAMRRLIRATRAQVVHTHQAKAGIIGRSATASQNATTVHWVHGPSFGQGYSAASSALYREAERTANRLTDRWVFVGDELRRNYVDAGVCDPQKTAIVRSPIDVDTLIGLRTLGADDKCQLKTRFGLDPERPVLINIGAMESRKRHDLVIRSVARVEEFKPQVLLVGQGPEQPALQSLSEALGLGSAIRFVGHVDDITNLLAISNVLVHASEREGASQVIIQALAAGLPVVATQTCGLHEVRGSSVLVAAANPASLSAAIEETLRHSPSAAPVSSFRPWQPAARRDALVNLYSGLTSPFGNTHALRRHHG